MIVKIGAICSPRSFMMWPGSASRTPVIDDLIPRRDFNFRSGNLEIWHCRVIYSRHIRFIFVDRNRAAVCDKYLIFCICLTSILLSLYSNTLYGNKIKKHDLFITSTWLLLLYSKCYFLTLAKRNILAFLKVILLFKSDDVSECKRYYITWVFSYVKIFWDIYFIHIWNIYWKKYAIKW